MVITAKFPSRCATCHAAIAVGTQIEWSKGQPARHTSCAPSSSAPRSAPRGKVWVSDKFNGYGAPRGGYARACKTGGNCSSFGSGKSCGAPDCDGY